MGFGDIAPTGSGQISFSLFLLVVGTFMYTIIVGMLSRTISESGDLEKAKKYEILGELYLNDLVKRPLLLEISDHIESSTGNKERRSYLYKSDLIEDFSGREQDLVLESLTAR